MKIPQKMQEKLLNEALKSFFERFQINPSKDKSRIKCGFMYGVAFMTGFTGDKTFIKALEVFPRVDNAPKP